MCRYTDAYEGQEARPPLVIVLEDFEGFPPHVLEDLIACCRYFAIYRFIPQSELGIGFSHYQS